MEGNILFRVIKSRDRFRRNFPTERKRLETTYSAFERFDKIYMMNDRSIVAIIQ